MAKQTPPKKKTPPTREVFPGSIFFWIFLFLIIFYVVHLGSAPAEKGMRQLKYGEFYSILSANKQNHELKSGVRIATEIAGEFTSGERYRVTTPEQDPDLERMLRDNLPVYEIRPEKTFWSQVLYQAIGSIIFVGLFWFLMYRASGGAGGGGKLMAFGRSRARLSQDAKITFQDVAGVEEAKEELKEIIEFLKEPKKFQRLGGKIPRGVLLMGPPGTGKTLLARAVSGEADVPFFSISGSDFVEMFVGVGASRVRDLFEQAKKSVKASGKGCIVFIDEIDAVGRQRFAGIGGGHDEREQTLNALLVEMDGFNTSEAVILIAATNRPDVLDPALLRPGRFDRQVVVPLPDLVGREAILKVHAAKVKLDPAVDLGKLARQTTYFSGADLANLVNEAALLAARLNKEAVSMSELQEATERVMAGPQRKSKKVSDREKRIVAYHESGHALMGLLMPGSDPLHKVTVIPRGMAGGYTVTLPEEERQFHGRLYFQSRLAVMMGGRVAEEIALSDITTGAHEDLQKATQLARDMVCQYGMSEKLGPVTFGKETGMVFLGRDFGDERKYSEDTSKIIDSEVKRILEEAYSAAKKILSSNRDKLDLLAKTLIEKETLDASEVRQLLGLPEEQSPASSAPPMTLHTSKP